MAEVQQYASLVDLGRPDFIEIKVWIGKCGEYPPIRMPYFHNG